LKLGTGAWDQKIRMGLPGR